MQNSPKTLYLTAVLALLTPSHGAAVVNSDESAREISVAPHPVFGPLTPAQAALLGPDKDANGVRDDVDQYIAGRYAVTDLMRRAVTAYASAVAYSMLTADKALSDEESTRRLAIFFCASDEIERNNVPHSDRWNKAIVAQTTNTVERLRAYDKWNRAQSSATSLTMEVDTCITAGLVPAPPEAAVELTEPPPANATTSPLRSPFRRLIRGG